MKRRTASVDVPLLILLGLGVLLTLGATAREILFVPHDQSRESSTSTGSAKTYVSSSTLPSISADEIARHDGTDERLPIYIVLDGYVYDVTGGRIFYSVGGVYHYLAGKDSSKILRLFGADIIKEKYPIVGILSK